MISLDLKLTFRFKRQFHIWHWSILSGRGKHVCSFDLKLKFEFKLHLMIIIIIIDWLWPFDILLNVWLQLVDKKSKFISYFKVEEWLEKTVYDQLTKDILLNIWLVIFNEKFRFHIFKVEEWLEKTDYDQLTIYILLNVCFLILDKRLNSYLILRLKNGLRRLTMTLRYTFEIFD